MNVLEIAEITSILTRYDPNLTFYIMMRYTKDLEQAMKMCFMTEENKIPDHLIIHPEHRELMEHYGFDFENWEIDLLKTNSGIIIHGNES